MSAFASLIDRNKRAFDFEKSNWTEMIPKYFPRESFYKIDIRNKKFRFEQEQPEISLIETKPIAIRIKLDSEEIVELPIQLKDIADVIEESKYMLSFKDNWDDEGSVGYKKVTWIRACKFIANYSKWIFEKTELIMDLPKISHGPEGSIDIYWKNDEYRLLINIPESPTSPFSIYGDDYNSNKIKGTFDLSQFNYGMLLCLTTMK